jgi:acetate kinase
MGGAAKKASVPVLCDESSFMMVDSCARGIFTLNAGSSSLKFALFIEKNSDLVLSCHGAITHWGVSDQVPHFVAKNQQGEQIAEKFWASEFSYEAILLEVIQWIADHLAPIPLVAVGHRVVHGGQFYHQPVRVDALVLEHLASLNVLAPLHQPHNILPIKLLAVLHPDLLQVACFDTAFHHSNARVTRLYALPRKWSDAGVMRYGFHGLSYEYIASLLPHYEPRSALGKVIVAHLGNGASLCALEAGKSVASSMGFSALDGLPMGTRSGNVDPGVLLYLLQEKKLDVSALEHLLYHESGLLGISGISSDMQVLLQSEEASAQEAIDVFVYRVVRELGSLVAALGGLDVFVFTAGIGEHAVEIRQKVCAQLAYLGVELDERANEAGECHISRAESQVSVWVLPTNEEHIIAMHTHEIFIKEG